MIALAGGVGTLTEIGFAGIYDRPVVSLESHDLSTLEQTSTSRQSKRPRKPSMQLKPRSSSSLTIDISFGDF